MKYILFVFLLISLHGSAQDSTGQFTVKANIQFWQIVIDALNKSDYSHKEVTAAIEYITKQIQVQVRKSEATKPKEQPKPKN